MRRDVKDKRAKWGATECRVKVVQSPRCGHFSFNVDFFWREATTAQPSLHNGYQLDKASYRQQPPYIGQSRRRTVCGLGTACEENKAHFYRLGIALTKILVLQYSNQETSVTIGESVRDEDGTHNLYSTYRTWH